ncbi:glycoside hydrolase family 2 TIM barrel-domain containing protein [Curtobacterium flaccumfaciens]|uniref:glycoside hydrolase family 2 TIM barrel-domain containing protein n=1 Tax=Curtobacterium flaccumfaciens TaxID=2035 RepID=UPI003419F68C
MSTIPFNRGWIVRAPRGPFAVSDPDTSEREVTLPHDALRDMPRNPAAPGRGAMAYYPDSAFAYVKRFTVPSEWAGMTVHLEIEGAQRRAQVFVNDEFVGNRADGYARFLIDLGPYLQYGAENEIRVEVRTGQDSRWYSGAGLHRPVRLHIAPGVHIVPDGVEVDTVRLDDDQAIIEVRSRVKNNDRLTRTTRVATAIVAPDGKTRSTDAPITLVPGESGIVRHRFVLEDPHLWSPDTPALHQATVSLNHGVQTVDVSFGVRTVTVDPRKGLQINGRPVLLRGACIHHDNGPLGAAAVGRAEERRIERLKAAGFNAIRAAHNPLSSAMLDACDRLGVLVMDEAFDMWTRFKSLRDYSFDFPQWWEADLAAMVAKDRNHPSVIMYSIGNEIIEVGTPHGSRLARHLTEHVRTLDPTRLVTNGVNAMLAVIDELGNLIDPAVSLNEAGDVFNIAGSSATATNRTEESSAVLDVVGFNYAESRYALDAELFPDRVIVGSETFPTRIGVLWPMVQSSPNVIGDFTWTGWDYLGEVGIGATAYAEDPDAVPALEREYPFLTAWSGDIDITGHRRPVSYYREIVFGLRHEPYIAVRRPNHHGETISMQSPWAWSDSVASWTWPGFEGAPVTVEVYGQGDEAVLIRDGAEVARGAIGTVLPQQAVLELTYQPGELVAVVFRDQVEVGRTTLHTAGAPQLCADSDRSELTADDDDLAFIEIELRDAAGRLTTANDTLVTVTVEGAAELAGMASARPKTTERFDAASWETFDGRVLAVVRPLAAGQATVTVQGDGLNTTAVNLQIVDGGGSSGTALADQAAD